MKFSTAWLAAVPVLLASVPAWAQEADEGSTEYQLSVTGGVGAVLQKGEEMQYMEPSLEVTPSAGWKYARFDLGIYTSMTEPPEGRSFTLRPGFMLTPPILPIFARMGFPLQFSPEFDFGVLVGLGFDMPVLPYIGAILEFDTYLTDGLGWGEQIPTELRAGLRVHF